ncbi:unnamed protein product [Prunus armeniaca]
MEVKNAFLHEDLEKEVFMKLSPSHPQINNCKLHKSIYGLKQSSRAWYANGSVGKLVVLIYVDDLIVTGENADEINNLKWNLQQKFSIKDLGVLKYFLGIEMATSHKGLFLNQRNYVLDLLNESSMHDSKPAHTPLDSNLKLDMEAW